MGVNTRYKDTVFSFLFSDPDVLRALYCALENVTLPEDVPVAINTLQDVLFMNMMNDISFEIGGKLIVLIEHQSTINPNMALRLLMYIARVYDINEGRNEEIGRKCRTLAEYSAFIGKVREYEKGSGDKEEAIKRAIIYCRGHDILSGFLEKNATEVMNMLMTEWKMDDALAVRYKEGREEGRENEREEIARRALAEGASVEFVGLITGLDMEVIKKLQEP